MPKSDEILFSQWDAIQLQCCDTTKLYVHKKQSCDVTALFGIFLEKKIQTNLLIPPRFIYFMKKKEKVILAGSAFYQIWLGQSHPNHIRQLFGKMHFLLTSESEFFFHEINGDGSFMDFMANNQVKDKAKTHIKQPLLCLHLHGKTCHCIKLHIIINI